MSARLSGKFENGIIKSLFTQGPGDTYCSAGGVFSVSISGLNDPLFKGKVLFCNSVHEPTLDNPVKNFALYRDSGYGLSIEYFNGKTVQIWGESKNMASALAPSKGKIQFSTAKGKWFDFHKLEGQTSRVIEFPSEPLQVVNFNCSDILVGFSRAQF